MAKKDSSIFMLANRVRMATLLFLLLSVALFPGFSKAAEEAAPAEEEAEEVVEMTEYTIRLGIAFTDLDNESFKHGEYSGVTDDQTDIIADLNYKSYNGTRYIELRGRDLGLENRFVDLDIGNAGGVQLSLDYNAIPHYIAQGKVLHDGAGTGVLTLPTGFTTGGTPRDVVSQTGYETFKKNHDLDMTRTRIGGTLLIPWHKWYLEAEYLSDTKEGTKSLGSVVGNFSGDRRSIVLPERVDYTNNEFSVALGYKVPVGFFKVKYWVSSFTNNQDSLTWETPYTAAGLSNLSYPGDTGATNSAMTLLPPDNTAQRLSFSGNISLGKTTRISLLYETGENKQDDQFVPYSTNVTDTTLLPAQNAAGKVDIQNMIVGISARPFSKVSVSAKYKHYKTDNKTPINTYLYARNDGDAQTTQAANNALNNLPFGTTQDQIKLNTVINVRRFTNLKLAYVNERIERTYREIPKTKEDTFKIALNSRLSPKIIWRLNYATSARTADGGGYDHSRLFDSYHTAEYLATISDTTLQFVNNPSIRKYDIAERDRDKYGAKIFLYPTDVATLGFYYNYAKDDYTANSSLGMQESELENYTIDFSWTASDDLSLTGFYSLETIQGRQIGRYYTQNVDGNYNDTDSNWTANHFDSIPTYGIGLSWAVSMNLSIDADYSYSEGTSSIKFGAGAALATPDNMPDIKTKLTNISIKAGYEINESWKLGLGYEYESYESNDFATAGLEPLSDTLPQVMTMTGAIPDYTGHTGLLYVTYSFVTEE